MSAMSGEMAQWVKVPAAKTNNLTWIPRLNDRKKANSSKLCLPHVSQHIYNRTYIHARCTNAILKEKSNHQAPVSYSRNLPAGISLVQLGQEYYGSNQPFFGWT